MEDDEALKEMQSRFVIQYLMKDKGYKLSEATKIWYNSKTKKLLFDSGEDYTYLAPTRCYDELLMELNKDTHWMKGQFE